MRRYAAPVSTLCGAPHNVETGDGWVDPRGSFLAALAASPAWTVLGAPGLSASEFPEVLTPVVEGNVGYRQHRGGHDDRDNWPTFIAFARAKLHPN